ncbi:LHFPL tetraspan subfamily member 7 protein-like [Watersipora subatra]|uniref:LHFPL tetraspan subfamily member 7 protein-like n=1 Tax=Watersipora subatra TaxID=2589382 RepID=UPI00355AF292
MDYSPHLVRTPRTLRTKASSSAPPTPNIGYVLPNRSPSHSHHYAGILMQHDGSNSDSSAGYISPTQKTTGTSYGTLQTEVSLGAPQAGQYIVADMTSMGSNNLSPKISVRKSIAWIWVAINVTIFGFCSFSLFQPSWLVNGQTKGSLGLVKYCEVGVSPSSELEKCHYYSKSASVLPTLESLPWQLAVILYLISSAVLGVSAVLSSLCLCIPQMSTVDKITLLSGFQQLIAGILLLTSLVIIPIGFEEPGVREICGDTSGLYNPGTCYIGWSYIIPAGCCALCFSLPLLSHYVTYLPKYYNLI